MGPWECASVAMGCQLCNLWVPSHCMAPGDFYHILPAWQWLCQQRAEEEQSDFQHHHRFLAQSTRTGEQVGPRWQRDATIHATMRQVLAVALYSSPVLLLEQNASFLIQTSTP